LIGFTLYLIQFVTFEHQTYTIEMQKKYLTLILTLFCAQAIFAQTKTPKLSAATKQYLFLSQHQQNKVFEQYVYHTDQQNNIFINAIFKVDNAFDDAQLKQLGVKIGTKAKDIWTAKIPLNAVHQFVKTTGIQYIDMDQPCYPELDTARRVTRVDSVHQGIFLPQSYTGKNVVVGIVDAGFDYTHPTFFDTTLTHYRIKKVWEQKNNTGIAPVNFGFGSEYSDSTSIWNKHYDVTETTHGTHVMGIAGGSGGASSANNRRFRGMAFESELVAVAIYPTAAHWLNTGSVDFLDGINYVFNYANSVNKPAVANLSWGCPLGPRDGTSLFSQACNNLVGPGKIFALSGGNNGNNNIHLKKTFTSTNNSVNTICSFSSYLVVKKNQLDVWGEPGKSFCMSFSLYSGFTKIDSTTTICLDDSTHQYKLIGTNGDTLFITITTVTSEFNNKPHMLVQLYSRVTDRLAVKITGNEGTVNMWQGIVINTSGYYGTFSKINYPWAVDGDNLMTCGDLVSTQQALAVAAYNSKPSFTNISGDNLSWQGYAKGAIALFSSKGPTADGRVKPDIAGPGLVLASAVSGVDSTYLVGGDDYSSVIATGVSPINGQTYSYAVAGGTSMSSPAVSGIVALLLQVDSTLNPVEVKDLLFNTAILDTKTGAIPDSGSTIWGHGKVNAYGAMASLLGVLSVKNGTSNLHCNIFPNPSDGRYQLEVFSNQNDLANLTVTDITGRIIKHSVEQINAGLTLINVNISESGKGIYFVKVNSSKGFNTMKIVKE
jgi:minor extracellular serine protease Vpr